MAPTDTELQLIARLDRLEDKIDKLIEMKVDIATLKATARFWGVLAGSITGIIGAICAVFTAARS